MISDYYFSVKVMLSFVFCLFSELLGDLLKTRPKESDGIDNIILVDNVPQVGPERQDKLKNVIHKIFEKFGKINREFFPVSGDKTKGYAVVEFNERK